MKPVDVSDLEKMFKFELNLSANYSSIVWFREISNPEMDLACKNTLSNQISSFYDMYHAIYGRLSILYTT